MRNHDIHTPAGKRAFMYQYLAALRKSMLDAIPKMPDEWDGYELRWIVSDKCHWETERYDGRSQRVKDYKNEVLVNNII